MLRRDGRTKPAPRPLDLGGSGVCDRVRRARDARGPSRWAGLRRAVLRWLRGLPVPAWFWEACTFLGGAILIAIGFAFGLAALLSRRYRLVLIIAVVLIGSALLTDAVKDLVMRQRPPDPITGTNGYSFPSGHTLNSTATYGLLAVIAWRSRLSLGLRRAAVAIGSSSRSSSGSRGSRSAPTGPPTCSPAGWPAPRSWRWAPCSSADRGDGPG